jgi:transcriptional regulator with GAF, ATPase, and Fis domain
LRELINAIRRSALLAKEELIRRNMLPCEFMSDDQGPLNDVLKLISQEDNVPEQIKMRTI